MLRIFAILNTVFCLTNSSVAQVQLPADDPYEKLQGVWQITSAMGRPVDSDETGDIKVTGRRIEVSFEVDALFTVDATKKPMHMDLHMSLGGKKGVFPCVCEIDGDTLTLSLCKLIPPKKEGEIAKAGPRPPSLKVQDGVVFVGKKSKTTRPIAQVAIPGSAHHLNFGAIGVSPDSKQAAILVADEFVFWDLQKNEAYDRIPLSSPVEFNVGIAVHFLPHGRHVLFDRNVFDQKQRKVVATLPAGRPFDVSRDGRFVLTAGSDEFDAPLCIVNTSDWKIAKKFSTNEESYNSGPPNARFTPDGKSIVSIEEEVLSVWDVATSKRIHQLQLPGDDDAYKDLRYLAVSADNSLVATRSEYPDRIAVWNLNTGKLVQQFASRGESHELSFRGDTHELVSSFRDGFHVWNADTGAYLKSIRLNESPYRSFKLTPDGKLLITCTGDGSKILSMENEFAGKTVVYPPASMVNGKKFRSNGKKPGVTIPNNPYAAKEETVGEEKSIGANTSPSKSTIPDAGMTAEIEIVSAKFGTQNRKTDVTEIVRKAIEPNADKLTVSAKGLGVKDPALRVKKKLVVEYKFKGQAKRKTINGGPDRRVNLRSLLTGSATKTVSGSWVSLFNGKDLNAWESSSSPVETWKIADGAMQSPDIGGGGGWLMAPGEFSDFELQLEFRLSENANSGVFLRAPAESSYPHIEGLEVQLVDDKSGTRGSASSRCGAVLLECGPSLNASKPAGEWQTLTITCVGSTISVVLNSKEVVSRDFSKTEASEPHEGRTRKSGRIGFQDRGEKVEFRKVRVKQL